MTGSTSTISVLADREVTLINVFDVEPARQLELVEALAIATHEIFMTRPGFISANLHVSLDGRRVINYAQWTSEQTYQESLQGADVQNHMATAAAVATSFDPTLVQVSSVLTRPVAEDD